MSREGEAREVGTVTKKMPRKRLQAKVKQEKRADGGVVRVGNTLPTFAKIGLSVKERMLPLGGANRHPPLGVVADDSNDELFNELGKNIRESGMKER